LTAQWSTIGNNALVGGPSNNAARWVTDTSTTNQFVQATYLGGIQVGVALAMPALTSSPTVTAAGTWYALRQSTAGGGVRLVQKDTGLGTTTNLQTVSATDLVPGQILRLEYRSGVLYSYIDGVQQTTFTPGTPITGQVGVGHQDANAANSGLPILDDWSGGDYSASGGVGFARVATDAAGLTDSVALSLTSVVTDDAGSTDSTALSQTLVVTDDAGLFDPAPTVAKGLGVTQTDDAGLADPAPTLVKALGVSQDDSAGLNDSISSRFSPSITDDAGLVDSLAFALSPVVTDSAGLSDLASALPVGSAEFTEDFEGGANGVQATATTTAFSGAVGAAATMTHSTLRSILGSTSLRLLNPTATAGLYRTFGTPTAGSDFFTRANGALGSNWLATTNPCTIFNNSVRASTSGVNAERWVTSTISDDQFAQVTYLAGVTVGPAVAMDTFAGTPSMANSGTFYCFYPLVGGGCVIGQKTAGSTAINQLATSATNPVANDVLRLEYVSGVLTAKINGTTVLTYTPSTPIVNQRGVGFFQDSSAIGTAGTVILDTWSGGDTGVGTLTRTANYQRIYWYPASSTTAANIMAVQTGATVQSNVQYNASNTKLRLRDGLSTVTATSANNVVLNQWYRLEHFVDTSAGTHTLRIFTGTNLHGSNPSETLTGTCATGTFNRAQVGTNGASTIDWFFDSYALDPNNWIGPVSIGGLPTLNEDTGLTDTLALSRGLVVSDSAGVSDNATPTKGVIQTDSVGLSDASIFIAKGPVFTDSAGLVDTKALLFGDSITDDVGLTDPAPTLTQSTLSFFEDFEGAANGVQADNTTTLFDGGVFGATMTHSTARAVSGTHSLRILNPTAQNSLYLSVVQTPIWYRRVYIYVASIATNGVNVWTVRNTNNNFANVFINADRTLDLRDGTTTVASTTALAANQWHRLEWKLDTTTTTQTLRVYSGVNLQSASTFSQEKSGSLVGAPSGGLYNRMYLGTSGAATQDIYYDAYADSPSDWIGPLGAFAPITDEAGLDDSLKFSRTLVFTDSTGLFDQASSLPGLPPFTDNAGLIDSPTRTGLAGTTSDPMGITDRADLVKGTGVAPIVRSGDDTASVSDAGAEFDVDLTADDDGGLDEALAFSQAMVLTDSTGLGDQLATQAPLSRTFPDTLGLTDSLTFSQTKVLSDGMGLGDSVALSRTLTLADSAGLDDAAAAGAPPTMGSLSSPTAIPARIIPGTSRPAYFQSRNISRTFGPDDAGLSDAVVFSLTKYLTDLEGPTELTVTPVLGVFLPRSFFDDAGLNDSLRQDFSPTVTDSTGLVDLPPILQAPTVLTQPADDSAGLTDSVVFILRKTVSTENVGLKDSPTAVGLAGTTTDPMGLSDKATPAFVAPPTFSRSPLDSTPLSDAGFEIDLDITVDDPAGLIDTFRIDPLQVSFTDDAGLLDTGLVTVGRVRTDQVGLTDSSAFTRSLVLTDSAGLTDPTPTVERTAGGRVFDDPAGLADKAFVFTGQSLFNDTEALSDFVSFDIGRGVTDTETLTEPGTSLVFDRRPSFTDPEGLSDTPPLVVSFNRRSDDTEGLTDSAALDHTLVLTDSTGLNDQANVNGVLVQPADDTEALSDTTQFTLAQSITDSTGLSDVETHSGTQTFNDSTGLGDNVTTEGSGQVNPTDLVGLLDTVVFDRALVLTDSIGLFDNDTAAVTFRISMTDPSGLTDFAAQSRSLVVSDSAGLADSDAESLGKAVSLTDPTGLTDTSVLMQAPVVDDRLDLSDMTAFTVSEQVTDSAGLSDSATVEATFMFAATDDAGISDTTDLGLGKDLTLSDPLDLTDDASYTIEGTPEIVDPIDLTDSLVFVFDTHLEFTDEVGLSDYNVSVVRLDTRIYPPEDRTLHICAENRTHRIQAEHRILPIDPEFRRHRVRIGAVAFEPCKTC
jgi:hypothetical protein